MSGSIRRVAVLLAMVACGCATRRVPFEMEVSRDLPAPCEVVLKSGERIPLDQGRVTRDSVVGTRRSGGPVAVPRDSVVAIEERRVDVESAIPVVFLVGMIPLWAAFAVGIVKLMKHSH